MANFPEAATFPNSFVDVVQPLAPGIGERGDAALARLRDRGFIVATGLTKYFAGAVGVMGQQSHIREYCPKDSMSKRFATEESTRVWLLKNGGRAMFLLLRQVARIDGVAGYQLAGYGWTGYEPCKQLPEFPITSAYRLGKTALKKHLSGDFVQTVVSGTYALYAPAGGIGLETWQSNDASNLYPKVGFEIQPNPGQKPELRPTLDPKAKDGQVMDTRIYMGYPNELLA